MKPDKYFLCFGFSNFHEADLKPFHVTLIYFGELTGEELLQVMNLTTKFTFDDNFAFIAQYSFTFEYEEMFGKNNDIRVLLPKQEHHLTKILRNDGNDLIALVGKYRKHNDFAFNPHLTTSLKSFTGRLNKLYLCKNSYEVVQSWNLLS